MVTRYRQSWHLNEFTLVHVVRYRDPLNKKIDEIIVNNKNTKTMSIPNVAPGQWTSVKPPDIAKATQFH